MPSAGGDICMGQCGLCPPTATEYPAAYISLPEGRSLPAKRSLAHESGGFTFPAPDLDAAHDPGHDFAAMRAAEALHTAPATPASIGKCEVRCGTASWTDPTLLQSGLFYPPDAHDAESRLRFYASRFPMVEVDSSYYAIPARRMAELWVERTPPDFIFNLKAHALMTGQPTEPKRLPAAIRNELPRDVAGKVRIYPRDVPHDLLAEVWAAFLDSIEPLRASGKLGAIILQYPRWFMPSRAAAETFADSRRRLGEIPAAVELRNRRWFETDERKRRLSSVLTAERMSLVLVDGPPGLESSVPPAMQVTDPSLVVIRMHGRRTQAWEARNVATVERYRYLYDHEQLGEWVDRVVDLASRADRVHVTMNNCHGNYGTANAIEFRAMLRTLEDS